MEQKSWGHTTQHTAQHSAAQQTAQSVERRALTPLGLSAPCPCFAAAVAATRTTGPRRRRRRSTRCSRTCRRRSWRSRRRCAPAERESPRERKMRPMAAAAAAGAGRRPARVCGRGVANATARRRTPTAPALPARLMAPRHARRPPPRKPSLWRLLCIQPRLRSACLPGGLGGCSARATPPARSARAPSKAASVRLATRSRSRHRCLMTLCRPAI